MSRRRPPRRRWHVGDPCLVPWYRSGGHGSGLPASWVPGSIGGWRRCEVVAVRGDTIITRHYRWESAHPWWELRVPPKHAGVCRFR